MSRLAQRSDEAYGGQKDDQNYPVYFQPGTQPSYSTSPNQFDFQGIQKQQNPITLQPGMKITRPPGPAASSHLWMPYPQVSTNCPPGLEYLCSVDQLLVHQKVELMEVLTGFETNNKYTVKNSIGQKVYYAIEDNDCCTRCCCGPSRPFEMKIMDNFMNEVIHLNRPLACSSCCFPCCLQTLEVSSPPGNVIGTVEQKWSICKPIFSIKNEVGDTVCRIQGPFCQCGLCRDVKFKVLSKDGEIIIGNITKQWSGMVKELYTDADNFNITFPINFDVKVKATLLGALFLIDFMYFEHSE